MTLSPISSFLSAVRAGLYQALPELSSRLEFHHRIAVPKETRRHGSLFIAPKTLQTRRLTAGLRNGATSTFGLALLVFLPDLDTQQADFSLLLHDEAFRIRRPFLGLLEGMSRLDTSASGFRVHPPTQDEGDIATSIDAGCPAVVLRPSVTLDHDYT